MLSPPDFYTGKIWLTKKLTSVTKSLECPDVVSAYHRYQNILAMMDFIFEDVILANSFVAVEAIYREALIQLHARRESFLHKLPQAKHSLLKLNVRHCQPEHEPRNCPD